MPNPEQDSLDEVFLSAKEQFEKDFKNSPLAPRAPIPQKHLRAILYEEWSSSVEAIEQKGVLVSATTFKMDRGMRRREVLQRGKPAVVIIGSFRFKHAIDNTIEQFTNTGIDVPMPPRGAVRTTQGDFPLLEGDHPDAIPEAIEDFYVQNLQAADFGYIVNPGGYIGEMSTIEIGLAMTRGVPLYSTDPIDLSRVPDNIPWKPTISLVKPYPIPELVAMAKQESFDTDDYPWFRPWNNKGTYRPAPDIDEMMRDANGIVL